MKRYAITLLFLAISLHAQTADYVPARQSLEARNWFTNNTHGLFIHWDPFSIPGSGGSSNRRYLIRK